MNNTGINSPEIHSEQIKNIIGRPLPWFLRHGSFLILFALAILVGIAYITPFTHYATGTATFVENQRVEIEIQYDILSQINEGQQVIIEAEGYLKATHGQIECRIISIDSSIIQISGDNYFIARAAITHTPIGINLTTGLKGKASIKTQDKSLLSAIFKSH